MVVVMVVVVVSVLGLIECFLSFFELLLSMLDILLKSLLLLSVSTTDFLLVLLDNIFVFLHDFSRSNNLHRSIKT